MRQVGKRLLVAVLFIFTTVFACYAQQDDDQAEASDSHTETVGLGRELQEFGERIHRPKWNRATQPSHRCPKHSAGASSPRSRS